MKIKYYIEDGEYGVDFNIHTKRDNSIIKEVSEEELHELIESDMCEIREKAMVALREL